MASWGRDRSRRLAFHAKLPRMSNKVIARCLDGRLLKGIGLDIDPARPTFHIRASDGKATEVRLDEIKALSFVHSLEGNPNHREDLTPVADDPRARGATVMSS